MPKTSLNFFRKIFSRNSSTPRRQLSMSDALPARKGGHTLNLTSRRWHIPVKEFFKTVAVLSAAWMMILGSAAAPTAPTANAQAEDRAALEKELHDLEGQITQYQNEISAYQKQGKTLSGEVGRLNAQISKINLQIKATNLKITDLDGKIGATGLKIRDLESSLDKNEANLAGIIRSLYKDESVSTLEILLRNSTMSDFMSDLSSMNLVQNNLRNTILQIRELRDELSQKKEELTVAKADAQVLKRSREVEKVEVDSTKSKKNQLLAATKGEEARYQSMLKETQAKAAQIRARLFNLLGGGAMSFGQAYDYAKVASNATGVRPALILAVLAQESALGKNVGQCTYHTAMNPKEKPVFIQITQKLGINPETQKVSCPNADGVYGGAMGPAQFIPSTWRGYEARVRGITGLSQASPWNNQDAFIASALYLKDAGAATNERMAAAKYYCGGNWNRYVCTEVYGRRVVDRAASFQSDIDILNS